MDYVYQKKEKKNGNCVISVRDRWENSIIEFEKKQHHIDIVVNYRNDKTTKYSIPIDICEKVYDDLQRGNWGDFGSFNYLRVTFIFAFLFITSIYLCLTKVTLLQSLITQHFDVTCQFSTTSSLVHIVSFLIQTYQSVHRSL